MLNLDENNCKLESKPHWVRAIQNTAGELEQETQSRKENLIEFFFTMTLILVALWLIAYPAVLLGIEWLNILAIVILAIGGITLLISPLIHKDEFSGWGLGNPITLYKDIKEAETPKKIILILIVGGLITGLTIAALVFWTYVAGFFGIDEQSALDFQNGPGGTMIVIFIGILISFLFATLIIRYDNFFSALLTAFKIILPLAILMIICALLINGPEAFMGFNPATMALSIFGYIFWGTIQQLLFSSYFGTRVRKGFAPAENPDDVKERRFWVAFLNGAFFGLLHIPSWILLGVTWLLGVFLSYVFMKDRNRNLVALGFVHGVLGSMLGWLFSSGESEEEGLGISMNVGPWSMDYLDVSIFIFVGILVALFVAAMIYVYIKWEE